MSEDIRSVLVAGGTGFVGRALLPMLAAAGYNVHATARDVTRVPSAPGVAWQPCDISQRPNLKRVLTGMDAAFYLVHSMGDGRSDFARAEQDAARLFREEAARAGLKRVVYLGGVAPSGDPSEHLKSRLAVGEILRAGAVPALELRASMIIGNGSASWQIVRDLALRLPAMLLPSWTDSRTCPIAIEDVGEALVRGLVIPLTKSAWYDIPGPDTVSAREILLQVAALRGRHVPSLRVPFLSVSLSSWWLKLVTRANFSVARELVLGLANDLLPRDARYWDEVHYFPKWSFKDSARRALAADANPSGASALGGKLEETAVQRVSRKLPR